MISQLSDGWKFEQVIGTRVARISCDLCSDYIENRPLAGRQRRISVQLQQRGPGRVSVRGFEGAVQQFQKL